MSPKIRGASKVCISMPVLVPKTSGDDALSVVK